MLLNQSCVVVHGWIEITIWAAVDGEAGLDEQKALTLGSLDRDIVIFSM